MPDPRRRHVLRYFEPADRFLRIAVAEAKHLGVRASAGLDGAAYRREIVRACVDELRAGVEGAPCELDDADAEHVVERLYRLCVEVNPGLDLRSVTLDEETSTTEAPGVQPVPSDAARPPRDLRRAVRGLAERLARRVIGQPDAVARVVQPLCRAAAGISESGRPLASFLLVGPTGTGKTELARALADELFAGELVRIDCSEFAQGHETSRLLGAPPGYIGYDRGGVLTSALQKAPAAVVLFDEIEKAHANLHHLLLQVLDEGHLTDHQGQRVSFDQALVVLTSNAGAADLAAARRPTGFRRSAPSADALSAVAEAALERGFPPELLARLDERIAFRELTHANRIAIARLQLAHLARRVRVRGARICFARSVAPWVAARGDAAGEGARELRHLIQREIESPLAERLLEMGGARPFLHARVRRGKIVLEPLD